jgi:hypothetical protein
MVHYLKAYARLIRKDLDFDNVISDKQLHVDMRQIQGIRFRTFKFRELIVDDYSGFCWNHFMKNKSELKKK